MSRYLMPGVATTRARSTRTGAVALLVATATVAACLIWRHADGDDRMHVTLRAEQLADGVTTGTTVRTRGVEIGEITGIVASGTRGIDLVLALDRSRVGQLDDSLGVDFAPSNLFGLSEVELVPGAGGTPLRDGAVVDLTGARADAVHDATMSAILRMFSDAVGEVLTPRLSTALAQLSDSIGAFTPLLRVAIALAEAVTDTRRVAASRLAHDYGRALDGAGEFTAATVEVFDVIRSNQPLREDRPHFDATVNAVVDDLLPAAVALGAAGERHVEGYLTSVVPLLRTMSAAVSRPVQSGAELRELLLRLHRAFADGPDGHPVLAVSVAVRGVPVLAQSLFAGPFVLPPSEGPR